MPFDRFGLDTAGDINLVSIMFSGWDNYSQSLKIFASKSVKDANFDKIIYDFHIDSFFHCLQILLTPSLHDQILLGPFFLT